MLPYKNYRVDLKGKYEKYLKVSFIVTLILVIAAFKFSPKPAKIEKITQIKEEPIIIEDPIQTTQITEPPPMPKPVIPVVALSDEIEDLIMKDISIDETSEYSKPPIIHKEKIVEDEIIIFKRVETKPEIIGGMKSLQEKIYYPEIVRRIGKEGEVIIEFIVNKDGDVESAKVLQSVIEPLDEICLNAVKELKFTPGMQRGKPVKVKMKIPINFKLK